MAWGHPLGLLERMILAYYKEVEDVALLKKDETRAINIYLSLKEGLRFLSL